MDNDDIKHHVTVISGGDMHDSEGLHVAAEDILNAIKSGSAESLASALHSFFQMVDEEPHEEGEHLAYGGKVGSIDDMGDKDGDGIDYITEQRKMARYFGER